MYTALGTSRIMHADTLKLNPTKQSTKSVDLRLLTQAIIHENPIPLPHMFNYLEYHPGSMKACRDDPKARPCRHTQNHRAHTL